MYLSPTERDILSTLATESPLLQASLTLRNAVNPQWEDPQYLVALLEPLRANFAHRFPAYRSELELLYLKAGLESRGENPWITLGPFNEEAMISLPAKFGSLTRIIYIRHGEIASAHSLQRSFNWSTRCRGREQLVTVLAENQYRFHGTNRRAGLLIPVRKADLQELLAAIVRQLQLPIQYTSDGVPRVCQCGIRASRECAVCGRNGLEGV